MRRPRRNLPVPTPQFPFSSPALADAVKRAVASYWEGRFGQAKRQIESGGRDTGSRGEVTGGLHLNAFCALLNEVIRSAGFNSNEILFKSGVDLPGYFRPTKKWDIVVVRDNRLCAAIEMKSQVGPSFGNNFNNRSEEAIGSSTDFWVAYREGALGPHQPWLGYFFIVEKADRSTTPVKLAKAVFEPMPVFSGTSYIDRYSILCRRLVLERNYTAAALITSPRGFNGEFEEPSKDLSFEHFVRSLFGHLVGIGLSRDA